MADLNTLPLYEKISVKRITQRALDVINLILLLSLLGYRLLSLYNHGFTWLQSIAFLCESWFTFTWLLLINITWNPIRYNTHPDRLLKRVEELPAIDIFVTTADPALEPPIITVNTVLSLLAVDYPANKLACYVSDDGCSPLTFYCLAEAMKFAQIWVPFCKKFRVQVRAPFRYFSDDFPSDVSAEFLSEWKRMKDEYERLRLAIEEAVQNSVELTGELADFSDVVPNNHPAIIKVIWENKEGLRDGLPHLIYVSREKRPRYPHNYKAGAMNVLGRVSGLMTNAPYMLNVDCDMFANDPNVLLHGMCLFLDPKIDKEYAFLQYPQCFYNGLKDDPYGNQWIVMMEFTFRGMAGLQGPGYMGTGCIHRRKVLYGQSPDGGKHHEDELFETFGTSKDFVNSVTRALRGITDRPNCLSSSVETSIEVAGCDYEHGSRWGSEVGWQYGSLLEDILTGMKIHRKGWKTAYMTPNPSAFLGCAPAGGPIPLNLQKRAMTGLLEIFFSKNCPIFTALFDKLQFRQSLSYVYILLLGLRSIPEILYAALPAFCLITNSHFLPKVQEPFMFIPLLLVVTYNLQLLLQYLETGQSVRAWWNNQRMDRINTMCASLFGVIGVVLKLLGVSETVFEVTKKESPSSSDDTESSEEGADSGRLTFDESPLFVVGTTVLMIQLSAVLMGLLRVAAGGGGLGVGEVVCSVWVIVWLWPFLRGMFGEGRFGIPSSTLCKSAAFTVLFIYFCQRTTIP